MVLLSAFADPAYGQPEIEYTAIQQLRLDYALPQLIEHADQFSPDLFVEDQHILQAQRDNNSAVFLLSLLPTPAYSFSDRDRGWRVSLNLSQIIAALTDKRESLSRLSDLAERKEHAIHRLHLKLVKLYQEVLSSKRRISDLKRKIQTQKKILNVNGQLHRFGQISDVQLFKEKQAVAELESELQSIFDRAVQELTELYFYAGFRITFNAAEAALSRAGVQSPLGWRAGSQREP